MRAPFRVVVITGASSGLGAALALLYAGPGVAMGLLGRNPDAWPPAPRHAAPPAPPSTARRSTSPTAGAGRLAGGLDNAHPLNS
jgi:NAD(P)-dependent dehydrogenase (short-subunit alcohol dehydrogenase family)